jgi:predicted ArsR family transcriptional regulator
MSRKPRQELTPASRPAGDRLLVILKTRGPQTAADLGAFLGVTGEAARQQLAKLAREADRGDRGAARCRTTGAGLVPTTKGNARFP